MMLKSISVVAALMVLGACVDPSATLDGDRRSTARSNGEMGVSLGGELRQPQLSVTAPSTAEANAFAVSFLNNLQLRSFAEHREHCGYFLIGPNGAISATAPRAGTLASCQSPYPPTNAFATYHTHGAYDRGYDNEVPSDADLLSDFSIGLDGYVSTPGGRIWHVENDNQTATQVCGRNCVAVDPGFRAEGDGSVRQSYTVATIRARH